MIKGFNIKVCGMRDAENIKALAELRPDFMGFIFYSKSKRDATDNLDKELLLSGLQGIKKVGVFVNEKTDVILNLVAEYSLDMVQLHGDEAPEQCQELKDNGLEIIKVFSIGETFDFSQLEPYLDVVDYFLFDTLGKQRGGNGVTFNWGVLKNYQYDKAFLLSGGLDTDNIKELESLNHPQLAGIDVNSKFEVAPGLKSIKKLEQLNFKKIREKYTSHGNKV